MSSYLNLSVEFHGDETELNDMLEAERKQPRQFAQRLIKLLSGLAAGSFNGRALSQVGSSSGTQAQWTIACTRANAADNYVTVAASVLTTSVTTNTSTSLTAVGDTRRMRIGDVISGTGIPVGTTITAIPTPSSEGVGVVTISAAATASATVTATVYERSKVFLEGVDFLRGADDTATGDNLAAAINASITAGSDLVGLFTSVGAVSVAGTITLISLAKTVVGQSITFATDDATAFAITNSVVGTNGVVRRGAIAHNFAESV